MAERHSSISLDNTSKGETEISTQHSERSTAQDTEVEVNYSGPFKAQRNAENYSTGTVEYFCATKKLIKYACGNFAIINDVPDDAKSRFFTGIKLNGYHTGRDTCGKDCGAAAMKYFRTKEEAKDQSVEWINEFLDKNPKPDPDSKRKTNEDDDGEEQELEMWCEARSLIYRPIPEEEIYAYDAKSRDT